MKKRKENTPYSEQLTLLLQVTGEQQDMKENFPMKSLREVEKKLEVSMFLQILSGRKGIKQLVLIHKVDTLLVQTT